MRHRWITAQGSSHVELIDDDNEKATDYRAKSGARKRARTRAQILEAILILIGRKHPADLLLEEILDTAGVSRGTLYAHFGSVRQAVEALTEEMAASSSKSVEGLYDHVQDPVHRVAVGSQLALWHAAMDINWGRAVSYCDGVADHTTFLAAVKRDIASGYKQGYFRHARTRALVDVHVGALLRASRQLTEMPRGRSAYITEVSLLMLLALGVTFEDASEAVAWAHQDLRKRAPNVVEWWNSFR
jgi:AcrR family transcriptional regulator